MKSYSRNISLERLKYLLHYNQETGVFTRKVARSGGGQKGSIAGYVSTVEGMSYWRITVDGEAILGHVLAWFYTYGEWPKNEIDHEDHNGLNNSIKNLREATVADNSKNRAFRNKSTGFTGVNLARNGKYIAQIRSNNTKYWLGTFDTLDLAVAARLAAEIKFGFHPNHGKL